MRLSEKTKADLAGAERRRMIEAEGRERAAAERREVGEGVAETVSLRQARGEAFETPRTGRGERDKPVRRLTGLEVLVRAGKISADALRCGQAYADAYEAAYRSPSPRSCLADFTGGGSSLDVSRIGAAARSRLVAVNRLTVMRAEMGNSPALIGAADAVFGMGMTPREAGRNGAEAQVFAALALAALDLMVVARREDVRMAA